MRGSELESLVRLFLRFPAWCFTLCVLGSCGDSTGPAPIVGEFVLTTVNGAPPPALVGATVACDESLLSGSLTLTASRDFALSGMVEFDCTRAGGQIDSQLLSVAGTYAQHGPNLTFIIPGAPLIAARFDGTVVTGTIPASPLTFPVAVALAFTRLTSP